MNISDTIQSTGSPECQCTNTWQPIVIIALQALGLSGSYLKYYLANRKQFNLLDAIRNMLSPNIPTEQVQLTFPEHLKSSITKDTKDTKDKDK